VLRIIAGRFKGRKLVSPAGRNTRPTADQVKEALFSMLESLPFELEGARVLDFFAGSGALALEAISRGASSAVLADQDKNSADAVRRNFQALGLTGAALFLNLRWPGGFKRLCGQPPFNLFFLDPPYEETELPLKLLKEVSSLGLAAPGAVAVWEQEPKTLELWGENELLPWKVVKTRSWGRQAVAFLRHEK